MSVDLLSGQPGAPPADAQRYLNREISALDYYARLLAIPEDPGWPVLERAKFSAIVSTLIDEFFYIRVAGLKDQVAAGIGATAPDGMSPAEQLLTIRDRVEQLVERQSRFFVDELVPALAAAGIQLVAWDDLSTDDRKHLANVFEDSIFPVLTPLAVDPGHPFPYISNLSLNLAVIVRDPTRGERRFARVKVPPLLPRFVAMPDGERWVPLEQVIAAFLDELFPGMEIESHHPFRVTRNADLTLEEEEADDLLAAVEMELRRRRFGRAVRLEINPGASDEVVDLLTAELDLSLEDVYTVPGLLDQSGLFALYDMDRPDLKDEPWTPTTPPRLADADDEPLDLFTAVRERDVLVHHPYDSFAGSVEAFVKQAARDPQVLAIKQTLYRTSGDSPIVKALIRAAERGKQVAALVELKARGDELANIAWARALEEAGVHVVYGLVGLKTHAKACLVVRQEPDGIRRYCHVGTGNYNSSTARGYEDIGLLTADPDLGADLTDLFNFLTGYSRQVEYRRLLLAPTLLRARILELIAAESTFGTAGRIVIKMNSLVDKSVIDALYEASQAGVRVDLIVRGICCLRPGVVGLSENISVRSLVGRYLEHSRIFYFGGGGQAKFFIGSADMMPRNLDRRVEAVVPIDDVDLQAQLEEILGVDLADDTLAWTLGPDARWTKVPTVVGVDAQRRFQELAEERAKRRREPESLRP